MITYANLFKTNIIKRKYNKDTMRISPVKKNKIFCIIINKKYSSTCSKVTTKKEKSQNINRYIIEINIYIDKL